MASNVTFQQYINKNGDCEFRAPFGRHKAVVYRRHENHFYVDIYDNKLGKTKFNGICLGLDELDFLTSIRSSLDRLQSSFPPKTTPLRSFGNGFGHGSSLWLTTVQPTSPGWLGTWRQRNNLMVAETAPYTCQPLQEITNGQGNNTSTAVMEPPRKRARYEAISPAPTDTPTDELLTQEMLNEFFHYPGM